MKRLINKLIKPLAPLAAGLALSLSSQSQTVTPDSVIYDIYNRQNTHLQYNKSPLEFYGSGDVNLDDTITYADAQAIANGTKNWMSDVNADSVTNEEDRQIILNYLNGTGKLPGLEYKNLSSQEKRDWIMKTAKNLDNTKYLPGQICSYQTKNLLHNFNGFYNKEGYYEEYDGEIIDTNMHAMMNLRGLYVSLTHINGVAHATPGFLTTDTLTNLKNYLIFDAVTKQNSDEFMRTEENDRVEISWYGYVKTFFGDSIFGNGRMIEFTFDNNNEPIISYVNPNLPQVNPDVINLNSSILEDKVLEYQSNLDLNSDEYGLPDYTTNLTLGNVLEVDGFYSSTTNNLLETKTELSEKTPLFDGEKGEYNYTIKKKFTGELKQKTKANTTNSGYDEVTIPLKKSSSTQVFTVLDRTAPKITLEDLADKNYTANLVIDKDLIIKSVTDNAKVDTSGIKDISSTQIMDQSYNEYNYTVSGKAFANDVSDNDTTLNWSFNVRDKESPKITLQNLADKNYIAGLTISKEDIIKSVTDNAKVDTSGIKDISSTQTMDGTINQVNYTVSGKAFANDVSDNDTTLNWSLNVKDISPPTDLIVPEDKTINLSDLENGVLTKEVTGIASAIDNSELPIDIDYNYTQTNEDDKNIYYDNVITFTDIAGNDTSAVQKVTVDKGVGIKDKVLPTGAVYPNPTTGKVSFNYTANGEVNFNVFNSTGQSLEKMVDNDGKADFNLSKYPQGVYFIRAEDKMGKTSTKKVIKK
jgi:hypothetical protein